jgi:TPR repeat protein
MIRTLALTGLSLLHVSNAGAQDLYTGIDAFESGDYQAALRELQPLAEDVPTAQYYLGLMYLLGAGVSQNDAEAIKLFRLAADWGVYEALASLGWMYQEGRGVAQDYTEAVNLYRLAANGGNALAQYYLGWMYQEGKGVPQSFTEAVAWYRRAAALGDANAQNNLGVLFINGTGVPQDTKEAVKWFKLAADHGNTNAQSNLVEAEKALVEEEKAAEAVPGSGNEATQVQRSGENDVVATSDCSEAIVFKDLCWAQGTTEMEDILSQQGYSCVQGGASNLGFGTVGKNGNLEIVINLDFQTVSFSCETFNGCGYSVKEIGQKIIEAGLVSNLTGEVRILSDGSEFEQYCGQGEGGDSICVQPGGLIVSSGVSVNLVKENYGTGGVSFD